MTPKNVPAPLRPRYEEISALIEAFCHASLNDEYLELCQEMAAVLSRKRPSPLSTGRANSWACAITFAVGRINFLFDRTQTPSMSQDDLCGYFGIGKSTAAAKALTILKTLKTMEMDPRWTVNIRLADNPLVWMVELDNGLIFDVRHLPRRRIVIRRVGVHPVTHAPRGNREHAA